MVAVFLISKCLVENSLETPGLTKTVHKESRQLAEVGRAIVVTSAKQGNAGLPAVRGGVTVLHGNVSWGPWPWPVSVGEVE